MADLERFVAAQDAGGTYSHALTELRAGRKRSHWMWFVFPQLAGLGRSHTAQFYGIIDADHARSYLAHPVLGHRLRECVDTLLALPDADPEAVLGPVDGMKLRSSLTLFGAVAEDEARFSAALAKFYDGEPDRVTMGLLDRDGE